MEDLPLSIHIHGVLPREQLPCSWQRCMQCFEPCSVPHNYYVSFLAEVWGKNTITVVMCVVISVSVDCRPTLLRLPNNPLNSIDPRAYLWSAHLFQTPKLPRPNYAANFWRLPPVFARHRQRSLRRCGQQEGAVLGQEVETLVAGDAGKHPQARQKRVGCQRVVQRPAARAARPPQVPHRHLRRKHTVSAVSTVQGPLQWRARSRAENVRTTAVACSAAQWPDISLDVEALRPLTQPNNRARHDARCQQARPTPGGT